ncbi:hypothetical protein BGX28_007947, partial [Mortierella sp. GBA30]
MIPGGYKRGPVTTYHAGDIIIPVRLWTYGMDYIRLPTSRMKNQSRHGGGTCEFSLSYDGGKTWKVIGQYTKSCPYVYYEWPVLIPKNIRSCTDSNKCLFAFSWVAYATNQFYHHCANVIIQGDKNGKVPRLDMTIVDVHQLKQKSNTHAEGDKGIKPSGPDPQEKLLNTNG